MGTRSHLPARWSRPTCSNWNTMSSSPRAASVNRRACSTVAAGVSPTVSRRPPKPPSTSRCISATNSWIRGPLMKYGEPSPYCDPSATTPSGRSSILRQHVDDVHAEPVDAAVEPPAHHLVDGRPDLRVLPVEVGLLAGEQVEVVLPRRRVELPHRTGEVRLPVGGLGSRRAGLGAGPRRAPPVPVALGVVDARARLDEPRVLVGRVVHHEVHHQLHAPLVHRGQQLVELLERAEGRIDVAVVADVVAVVVVR